MNKTLKMLGKGFLTILMVFGFITLSGCGGRTDVGEPRENIEAAEEVFHIGVNAYLWRAVLDTLSFMPMLQTTANDGVILTDWKVNPSDVNERTKVDVVIIGSELRADSLQIAIHRETLQNGNWTSIAPRADAQAQMIQAIIIQARILRRDNAPLTSY